MPYLPDADRKAVTGLDTIDLQEITVPGRLNYALQQCAFAYMQNRLGDLARYSTLAEVIGAFEAAKLEFYRKAIVPYEDKRCKEEGDLEWPK